MYEWGSLGLMRRLCTSYNASSTVITNDIVGRQDCLIEIFPYTHTRLAKLMTLLSMIEMILYTHKPGKAKLISKRSRLKVQARPLCLHTSVGTKASKQKCILLKTDYFKHLPSHETDLLRISKHMGIAGRSLDFNSIIILIFSPDVCYPIRSTYN